MTTKSRPSERRPTTLSASPSMPESGLVARARARRLPRARRCPGRDRRGRCDARCRSQVLRRGHTYGCHRGRRHHSLRHPRAVRRKRRLRRHHRTQPRGRGALRGRLLSRPPHPKATQEPHMDPPQATEQNAYVPPSNEYAELVRAHQRTPEGVAYEKLFLATQRLGRRPDSKRVADVQAENAALRALAEVTPGSVHVSQVLTNLSVQYANDEFIGERVMPVIFTGDKLAQTYFTYTKTDQFSYPDDTMAARTTANELNENRSTASVALQPRALREFVDQLVLQNQDAPLHELADAPNNLLNGMQFNREVRIATAIMAQANYGTQYTSLPAGDRWDSAGGGDPGGVVDDALAAVWSGMGPGRWVLVGSLAVFNVLKRHEGILDKFKFGGGGARFSTPAMLADFFGGDEFLVGRARQNTAHNGQTASYARIWADKLALVRVSS